MSQRIIDTQTSDGSEITDVSCLKLPLKYQCSGCDECISQRHLARLPDGYGSTDDGIIERKNIRDRKELLEVSFI